MGELHNTEAKFYFDDKFIYWMGIYKWHSAEQTFLCTNVGYRWMSAINNNYDFKIKDNQVNGYFVDHSAVLGLW